MSIDYVISIAAVALLVALYRRDRRHVRQRRASFFAQSLELFQSYKVVQDNIGYPTLRGRYKGWDVKLEPVVDNLGWRKLPVLFLDVTIFAPTGYPAVLDFLMRPNGSEIFSRISHIDYPVKIPPQWPQEALLRADRPNAVSAPDLEVLAPFAFRFFDPTWKEMVLTPKGVRFVRLIEQCSRAHYVAFRELKFADTVQSTLVQETLEAAIQLLRELQVTSQLKVA
jgi:hypothetical protein